MTEPNNFLKNSIIIAAHPDDELLWFTSILKDVDQVLVVYRNFWAHPEWGKNRARAIAQYPRPNINCLDLEEAGTYSCFDWKNPKFDSDGISLTKNRIRLELGRHLRRFINKQTRLKIPYAQCSVHTRNRENYYTLRNHLRTILKPNMNVFTHNPWGEYGHPDHVQLFHIVNQLRKEIGFTQWMSNYCTERTFILAQKYFVKKPEPYFRVKANKEFAQQIADHYIKNECWTWDPQWQWFDEEFYMQAPTYGPATPLEQSHLFPLNMFHIKNG